MVKVKSLAELKAMREKLQNTIDTRERGDNPEALVQVKVAMATCGIAAGAKQVMITITGMAAMELRLINSG